MYFADQSAHAGLCWTEATFLAAIGNGADLAHATRLLELHASLCDSYFWFGAAPNGAIFLHPLGLRYAPMSLWINKSGDLMGRGTWNRYPAIRTHRGFAELASYLGQDHESVASGFNVGEFDIDELWALMLLCAQRINGRIAIS